MASLPSGYIPCNWIGGKNCYFDTGVVPSSDLKVVGLFWSLTDVVYFFGARTTNSNNSAGQLNFLAAVQGGNAYIGYASARVTLQNFNGFGFQLTKDGNHFDIIDHYYLAELTGSTTQFTGTRPMYILAMNNAGNVMYGSGAASAYVCVAEFSISQNGTEIHHYVPVYDVANSRFGLWDLIDETLLTNQGTGSFYDMNLLEVQETEGGEAWIMTDSTGYTKQKYICKPVTNYAERLVAMPKPGYAFVNWTDSNGNVLSNESFFEYEESDLYIISANTTITANFVKKADIDRGGRYQTLGLQYGVGAIQSASDPDGILSDIYASVESFECEQDVMSSSTTRITLKDVPSLYTIDIPIFLYSPRGKAIWCGIIKAIEGNTLVCREAASILDFDIYFNQPSSDQEKARLRVALYTYVIQSLRYLNTSFSARQLNRAVGRMLNTTMFDVLQNWDSVNDARIVFGDVDYTLPSIETGLSNVESMLFQMTEQYGVIFQPTPYSYTNKNYPAKGVKHLLQVSFINPAKYGTLVLGTNSEAISNIEINEQGTNANSLTIFNSAGSSARGVYGVKKDGSIEDMSTLTSDFLAYDGCVNKTVASDDAIKALIRENLGNAQLNHKITFDVDLSSEMYNFDDFRLGRRVQFYDGGKMYNSMITATGFSGSANDEIKSLRVTLGNVRTKLTTKINIGKGK